MSFKSRYIFVVFAVAGFHASLSAQENLEIEGLGFFENMIYKGRLAFLQGVPAKEPTHLDAAFLEDSAYLLLQQLKRSGYLKPRIEGVFEVGDATKCAFWENEYSIQLDAEFLADRATFYLKPRVLYYYESVNVTGVPILDERTLRHYFIPYGTLLVTKSSRAFTEGNFKQRIRRLLGTLMQMGYRQAKLIGKDAMLNHDTGKVATAVSIELGPLHRVGQVTIEWMDAAGAVINTETESPDVLFTTGWERSRQQDLRNSAYRDGYADVEILQTTSETVLEKQDVLVVDVHYQVKLNSVVEFGGTRFSGDEATSMALLKRYIEMSVGEPLNPLLASKSRRQLMGLGIFKEIEMSYEPKGEPTRTVVYDLEPASRKKLDLLVGWGSYELMRVGFIWNQKNLFGRAHSYEINGKQSFRASNLGTTYSVPQFFGSDFTAYTSAEYSFREEVSFDLYRRAFTAGLSRVIAESDIVLTLEYSYAREDVDRESASDFESNEEANVGSASGKLSLDRRDNFLAPTKGHSIYSEINIASELLGSAVAFQKVELGASFHAAILEFLLLHLGIRTGAIVSEGYASDDIPFAERFFNGGENTVRGYLQGEASPIDANGEQIGAESFVLFNLELETRLLQNFSLVGFFDTVTNARDGYFESNVESLSSVGLGLRYQTVVGPIRLEYGRNLNPRDSDPSGALHFSIGFPF